MAQPLLNPAAYVDENVSWLALFDALEQFQIGKLPGWIKRRYVAVIASHGKPMSIEPGEVDFHLGSGGHNPKGGSRRLHLRISQQTAQQLKSGNTGETLASEDFPKHDHEGTVSDSEVALFHRFAVGRVGNQFNQGRGRRDDDEMTRATLEQTFEITREKPNAEDVLKCPCHSQKQSEIIDAPVIANGPSRS